jgi:hypothetical protein
MIRKQVIEIEPLLYYAMHPKCVWFGFCPLLDRSCGKADFTIKTEHQMLIDEINNKNNKGE